MCKLERLNKSSDSSGMIALRLANGTLSRGYEDIGEKDWLHRKRADRVRDNS